jgi:hypothetical protein
VPHDAGVEISYDQSIEWAAKVIMAIKYY